ncbi:1-hydroxy-2-methyl-2-butenyl 4-diphosphate reductase [Streptomyces sp. ODS28]|uniref:phosphorylase family protein n=1 Tax=Streptomyces sp. ODS28 TaxID=3136688 RepID=UPI0031E91628
MHGPPVPRPLLLACALGIERLALRGASGRAAVLRTGMGPRAARAAVTVALGEEPEAGGTAVLATGFCAGLAPGMRPGDLVVAEQTVDLTGGAPVPRTECGRSERAGTEHARTEHARTECAGTEVLVRALAESCPGRTVHTGTLAGVGRVVRGDRRAALREETGAVAADMESAAVLRAATAGAPVRPVAAVRVVVDAPRHELIRVGTLRGGISAFCVLHNATSAFFEWNHSFLLPRR